MARLQPPSPRTALAFACLWIVASIFFLDVGFGRIHQGHSSPIRYLQIVFWFAMLGYWGWNAWSSWKRMREQP